MPRITPGSKTAPVSINDVFNTGWRKRLIGAALVSGLGLLFLWVPFLDSLTNLSFDLPFFFKTPSQVDGAIVVYMDGESLETLKQVWDDRWDRALHARLIDHLTRSGARAVVFDSRFGGTNNPVADAQLVRAAKANGKVVVASQMTPQIVHGELIGWTLESAFDALRNVSVSGIVEEGGKNKTIRRHYRNPNYAMPSLSWKAAQLTMANPPPDPLRERWVNYYGPPGFIPNVSYAQVLQDTNFLQASTFSNQVVFVGARFDIGYIGGTGTDDFATPYTRWTGRISPGVEVNATAFLNLVRGDWLSRPSPLIETCFFVLVGTISVFGLFSYRPWIATGMAGAGAFLVTLAAILLMWQTHVWIPWMIIVCVQIPCALGGSILAHTKKLDREMRSLEQSLALLNRGEPLEQPNAEVPGRPVTAQLASFTPLPSPDEIRTLSPSKELPFVSDHQLLRCIGRGAYGEVWLARDIIGNYHAIKIVYRNNFKDARPLEREFNGIKKFTPISRSHPGFVHVLHVGRDDQAGYFYYVMELGDDRVTGQKIDPLTYNPKTLASELGQGRLPLPECLQIMIHLADALDYLHQHQLIHRDIKPSNIIYVDGVCKFADIGLVTDIATEGRDATYIGTPGRIAPEGPGTPGSDIYSLGKLLYEMGLGLDIERFPELPTTLVDGGGHEDLFLLNRIVMKACAKEPSQRYQRAAELRADLVTLQNRTVSAAKP
jgi:CHASE2 domain-containing sensor protein